MDRNIKTVSRATGIPYYTLNRVVKGTGNPKYDDVVRVIHYLEDTPPRLPTMRVSSFCKDEANV